MSNVEPNRKLYKYTETEYTEYLEGIDGNYNHKAFLEFENQKHLNASPFYFTQACRLFKSVCG